MTLPASVECRRTSRRTTEEIKAEGWREQGIFVGRIDDDKLTWDEREFLKQIGTRLYGPTNYKGNGNGKK